MKFAFSTLGCPDFSWTDIYSMAKDLNFDGIEIRGLGEDIFAVKAKPFTKSTIDAATLRKAYDEVKAEFADVFDEVKDFVGGWTTTIALSKK